jgi:lysine N6-hydroxylase
MDELDLIGIGIGPSNLSLAALLAPITRFRARFFDRRAAFGWHPGMMLPGTRMQTSFLKDLVTPVDPTSPFGFLSYLVARGCFYRFLNAEFSRVRRADFAEYLRWVADQLPNLSFAHEAVSVAHDEHGFSVAFTNGKQARAKNLVVATGLAPHVPAWASGHLGVDCVHSHTYLETPIEVAGRRVLVIGGGQSGAEIFLDLFGGRRGAPAEVVWATRRANLEPLDESAFANEYFTPEYVRQFHRLPAHRRSRLVDAQKLTGDGISPETLRELSQALYDRDFLAASGPSHRILPHREVRTLRRDRSAFQVVMHNDFTGADETLVADVVVLATGYRHRVPTCLDALAARLPYDEEGNVRLGEDYSVAIDGAPGHRIYMQNAGRYSHGVADAQLSLAAWRAAVIVNSLLVSEVYPAVAAAPPLDWCESESTEPWPEAPARSLLS